MHLKFGALGRVLGMLLILFGCTFLLPVLVSLIYRDHEAIHFLWSAAITIGLGTGLWWSGRRSRAPLHQRDGFITVAFFWVGLGLCGSLPLIFGPHLHDVDAVFEAVSGLTTTGATILEDIEALPPSLLYYRQQLQWLGGAGVVVLAVAVLPLLGIGGMQLYKAETPGPMKEEKLTPRIASSARALWLIYVALTAACAGAYWLAGMSAFDAINHSLATVSTGGFSTYNSSIGHFRNPAIELVAQVFMLAGAINFALHYAVLRRRRWQALWQDPEARLFLGLVLGATLLVSLGLWLGDRYPGPWTALRYGSFQVVSVITSTGFGTADFSLWPTFVPVLLIYISFIGGCAGSTAGGMKVVRVLLLSKLGAQETRRLVHPNAVTHVKLGGRVIGERTQEAVWGFLALYAATFSVLMLFMMATGLDQVTAFSAVATCMNNLGPGLGAVATSFHDLNDAAKIAAIAAMLLGRLEIYTLLVLLSPAFWRG